MSSGGMILAPVAVPVIAAGAVVLVGALAVGGAAVLAARAANAAVEGAVRYGNRMDEIAAAKDEAEADVLRWEASTADVVEVNARLRMLRERARSMGAQVDLPGPIVLTSRRSPAEVARLVAAARHEIVKAHQALDAQVEMPELTLVFQAVTTDVTASLALHREMLGKRHVAALAPQPAGVSFDTVEQLLTLLDPDATTREYAKTQAAAAQALAKGHRGPYLSELRQLIIADINPAVARRRLAAGWVEALDNGPLADVLAQVAMPARHRETVERLRVVAAGERDLDDDLRAEAARAMDWVQDTADQALLLEVARDCLARQGYEVMETFDVDNSVGLKLSRAEWAGEYTADVFIDRNKTINGKLVREYRASDDASARNRQHCDVFADDLENLAGEFTAQDVKSTVAVHRGSELDTRGNTTVGVRVRTKPALRYRDN